MSDWQPIETAPKDGEPILIGWQDETHGWQTRCAWWDERFAPDWDKETDGVNDYRPAWTDGRVMSFNYEETYEYTPTHWQPLPEPPAIEQP